MKQPWRRIAAWLIDWLVISVYVVILLALGLGSGAADRFASFSPVLYNVVGFVVLVAPVTIVFAGLEARGGTLGKRALGLVVTPAAASGQVSFSRTLVRNLLKIAVPWAIGHVAVYGFASAFLEVIPTWVYVVTVLSYVLPLVYLVSLFVRTGRTPYDLIAGTRVTLTTKDES